MEPVKLTYLKGSKETNAWMVDPAERRMWNIVSEHPRKGGTFSLPGLIRLGIVPESKKAAA